MEMKPSDRLDLRVFAITSRLKEISEEISRARGEAYELRERIESLTVSSLLEGERVPEGMDALRSRLAERESHAERQEQEEIRLKGTLLAARKEHLRQLKLERSSRWMILE